MTILPDLLVGRSRGLTPGDAVRAMEMLVP